MKVYRNSEENILVIIVKTSSQMSFASCCERRESKHSVWAGCGFLQVGWLSVGGFILQQAESGPGRMKGFFVLALSLTLLIFFSGEH